MKTTTNTREQQRLQNMGAVGDRSPVSAAQQQQQDMITSAPQQAAAAMGMVKKQEQQMSNAQYTAQTQLSERMVQELVKRGSGGNLMELNAVMQSPDRQAFINDIATSQAMFNAQAPELGAHRASVNQYS